MKEPIQAVLERRKIKVSPDELAQTIEDAFAAAGVPPYPKPYETLKPHQLDLLAKGGFEIEGPDLGMRDPVLRGALEYAAMRATALTTQEAADRLDVKDSRIQQQLASRELYGLRVDDEWRLPAFQFEEKGLVPHIERVFPRLDESLSAIAILRWFTSPNPDLSSKDTGEEPVSPIVWLKLGLDPGEVVELAGQL